MHHLFLFITAALFDLCVSLRKTGFFNERGELRACEGRRLLQKKFPVFSLMRAALFFEPSIYGNKQEFCNRLFYGGPLLNEVSCKRRNPNVFARKSLLSRN